MLRLLSKKITLVSSLLFMVIMFAISSTINPLIDGKNGFGLVELQLAFHKQAGIDIINGWGAAGLAAYSHYWYIDYLYAVSYSLFLAALLAFLIRKTELTDSPYKAALPFTLLAGVCDWMENTMEFIFIQSPADFPNNLFFLHSIVALLKWASIAIAVISIGLILISHRNKGQSGF